jgi:hypothetical protein
MTHGEAERLTQAATRCAHALALYARQWLDGAADDAVQEAVIAWLAQR